MFRYCDDELYHYGRKGMKWGQHIFGKESSPNLKNDRVIDKDTQFYRVTSNPNEDHNKRIYATTSFKDFTHYSESFTEGFLWTENNSQMYLTKLTAIKPMTVAKGEDVVKYITDTIGTKEEKAAVEYLKNINFDDNINSWDDTYASSQYWVRSQMLFRAMRDTKISSDVFNEFSKRGFDAITDPEDGLSKGSYEDPVIILNPKKSVKTTKVSKI